MVHYLVDLFCGIGGVSFGFQKKGFTVIGCADNWDKALSIHAKHMKECQHILLDLGTNKSKQAIINLIPRMKVGDTLHVHASPPCQNLSVINKRRNVDMGLELTIWTLKFLWELDDTFKKLNKNKFTWTMEQVPNKQLLSILSRSKVPIFYDVFTMTDYGVPQLRKRLIISNVLDLDKRMTTKSFGSLNKYLDIPLNAKYIAAPAYSKAKLKAGSSFVSLKLISDEMIPFTVLSKPAIYLDKNKNIIRPLSMEENLKLQGFPKTYFKNATNEVPQSSLRTMVGNSVPVGFSTTIASAILD